MKIPRAAADAITAALAAGRATAGPRAKVGGDPPAGPVVIDIPGLKVVSEQNQREHWAVKDKRRKAQREAVLSSIVVAGSGRTDGVVLGPGLTVRFHRRGPGLLDDDNLTGAFKHCRDAVAEWAGRDDADPWFTWVIPPTQERSRDYGVTITLEPREGV